MVLVVMAAGMGSRFGGLKQLTPVGPNGEFLIDYSVYDAIKVGIKKVLFVIKKEHLEQFKETIGNRIASKIEVEYVFQEVDDLPVAVKQDIVRLKPWGTGQALLTCRNAVHEPFIVINADDFYGRDAFQVLVNFLKKEVLHSNYKKHYAMVAYHLKNTLSQNGTVSRGICEVDNGYLRRVTERTKIGYIQGELVYLEKEGFHKIDGDSLVSVNLFGFTPEIFEDGMKYFKDFLASAQDLSTQEFYLPTIVQKSIDDGVADVTVLNTTSEFNGVTYQEDLEQLKQNIKRFIQKGFYPMNLWEDNDEK